MEQTVHKMPPGLIMRAAVGSDKAGRQAPTESSTARTAADPGVRELFRGWGLDPTPRRCYATAMRSMRHPRI